MTDEDRAAEYAQLFARAGRRWPECVPLDAIPVGLGRVKIGAVTLSQITASRWAPEIEPGQIWERTTRGVDQQVEVIEVGLRRATVRAAKRSEVKIDTIRRTYRLVRAALA